MFSFFDQGVGKHESYLGKKKLVTSSSYSGSTFVDLLSFQGYKIAVITVPMTYPPWSINGVMISGYPCPDTDKIYYCSGDMKIQIKENLNLPAEYYAHTSKEKIINDGLEMMERRTNLAIQIIKTNEIDCLILVLEAIDKAQHIF